MPNFIKVLFYDKIFTCTIKYNKIHIRQLYKIVYDDDFTIQIQIKMFVKLISYVYNNIHVYKNIQKMSNKIDVKK